MRGSGVVWWGVSQSETLHKPPGVSIVPAETILPGIFDVYFYVGILLVTVVSSESRARDESSCEPVLPLGCVYHVCSTSDSEEWQWRGIGIGSVGYRRIFPVYPSS